MDYYDYLLESMDYDSYDYDDLDPVEEAFIEGYMSAMENISEERKAELNKKYGGKYGRNKHTAQQEMLYRMKKEPWTDRPGRYLHKDTKEHKGSSQELERQVKRRFNDDGVKLTDKHNKRLADRYLVNSAKKDFYKSHPSTYNDLF